MPGSVKQLERDVEAARAKLAGDIAVLRSPGAFSELADTLKQAALERGGTMLEEAKSRGRSVFDDIIESVKEKAVANPAAALVIGAGIAWHLVVRRPVALALIGGGIFGLMRTETGNRVAGQSGDVLARARENLRGQTEALASKAGEVGRQAGDAARERIIGLMDEARHQASEWGEKAGEEVSRLAEEVGDRTSRFVDDVRETAADLADSARDAAAYRMSGQFPNPAENPLHDGGLDDDFLDGNGDAPAQGQSILRTDTVLIGAAGLMLGAAMAVLYQRRDSRFADDADRDE